MSEERRKRVSDHAHSLWEKEGKPSDRALDHWTEAERHIEQQEAVETDPGTARSKTAKPPAALQANEGEGNRTAAKAYNRKTKEFAESGQVEGKAKEAKADLDGPKGDELRKAETAGRRRSKGEDPAVKR
ncbi:MAG TPA: DUF2934 domain-containing protein [Aliidongia sp.]|nr:DUF2934 domain-containing protein [Aliidongia sp.]